MELSLECSGDQNEAYVPGTGEARVRAILLEATGAGRGPNGQGKECGSHARYNRWSLEGSQGRQVIWCDLYF